MVLVILCVQYVCITYSMTKNLIAAYMDNLCFTRPFFYPRTEYGSCTAQKACFGWAVPVTAALLRMAIKGTKCSNMSVIRYPASNSRVLY
jgi:hypothetical protein